MNKGKDAYKNIQRMKEKIAEGTMIVHFPDLSLSDAS